MKPKAVPPAITTGIGPPGAEVRHLQAPSRGDLAIEATFSSRVLEDNAFADETIDPALRAMSLPQSGSTPPETTPSEPATPRRRSVPEKENTPGCDSPRRSRGPRQLKDVLAKHGAPASEPAAGPAGVPGASPVKPGAASFEGNLLKLAQYVAIPQADSVLTSSQEVHRCNACS
jgi:hypothetical protein